MPVREFKCPHCFEVFLKPIEIIGRLPLIGTIFRRSSLKSATSGRSRSRSSRSDGSMTVTRKMARSLSNFGRRVSRAEQGVVSGFLKLIYLLNPVRWMSKSSRRTRRDRSRSSKQGGSGD